MYVNVVLNTKQAGIGNGLTYRSENAQVGSLVKVPLRRRLIEGIVVDVHNQKPEGDFDVKEVSEVIAENFLSRQQIETAKWMADYYVCSLRQALSVWMPGGEWVKLLPERRVMVRVVSSLGSARDDKKRMGKKQEALLEYLRGKDWVEWEKVREELGVGRDVVKRLEGRGFIELKEERNRVETRDSRVSTNNHVLLSDVSLTPTQTAAYKAMQSNPRPSLLFGVTGSGKTEIYAALIRDAIQNGKSAILLLPEILLTENFIDRFQQLVDRDAIALIHSRLTPAQRRDAWRNCHSGQIKLAIGSRSALFSPLQDLGLIILDEEHEWTYKNEQTPRYHAGKVAEHMCEKQRVMPSSAAVPLGTTSASLRSTRDDIAARTEAPCCKLVLGSATPSVESWHKAKEGQYQLIELPERYGGAALPSVQVVDLAQVAFGEYYPLSPTLVNAIRTRLERHEQCVLFLNRRGFATSLMCLDCRYRFEDPETKLPYTVHHRGARPYLLSHHTGEEQSIPEKCPKCASSKLFEVGAGTQRIEKLLEQIFPEARVLRADADTLKTPEKMRLLLQKMKEGKADILLGTQSVVKGLDLPQVTLAAVLLADVGLSLPHFRAGERVFQLLTQLTGRSGRAQPGEVIIQTFRPDAVEVELAARHDVKTYLEQELLERAKVHYPPKSDLVRYVFSSPSAAKESKQFLQHVRKMPGVIASRTPSLFSAKTWYVFIRGQNAHFAHKNVPGFSGVVDRDPVECL